MESSTLTQNEKLARILFFVYILSTSAFKRGYGFDAIFCRLTFVVLMVYEVMINLLKYQKHKFHVTPMMKWYFFFVAYYFISMAWGNLDDGLYYVNNFAQIIGLSIFFTQHVKSEQDMLDYYKIIVLSLIVTAGVVIARAPVSSWGSSRLGRELALNANAVGIRFALGSVLALFFSSQKKYYYLPLFLFGSITLFSGSRTALVIIIGSIIAYFAFKNKGFKTLRNIIIIGIIVTAIFYIMFHVPALYDTIGRRLIIYWNTANGEQTIVNGNVRFDNSALERAYYRQYALQMFLSSPFFGHGANSFVTEMRRIGYSHVAYSHNTYTEIFATLGFVGGVLYFTPQIITFISKAKKVIRDHSPYNAMCFSLIFVILLAQWQTITYIDPIEQSFIMLIVLSTVNLGDGQTELSEQI